jgi:hypothetical protein
MLLLRLRSDHTISINSGLKTAGRLMRIDLFYQTSHFHARLKLSLAHVEFSLYQIDETKWRECNSLAT